MYLQALRKEIGRPMKQEVCLKRWSTNMSLGVHHHYSRRNERVRGSCLHGFSNNKTRLLSNIVAFAMRRADMIEDRNQYTHVTVLDLSSRASARKLCTFMLPFGVYCHEWLSIESSLIRIPFDNEFLSYLWWRRCREVL